MTINSTIGVSYPLLSQQKFLNSSSLRRDILPSSPVATEGRWWVQPPKRTSKPPKLKYETLLICGVFVDFKNVKPPPIEVFLATVLLPSEALFPTHTHRHIINKQLETKVRVV